MLVFKYPKSDHYQISMNWFKRKIKNEKGKFCLNLIEIIYF